MTKKINFTLEKVTTNNEKSIVHLEFDSPVIFDTAGTFNDLKKANEYVEWQVKHMFLKSSLKDPHNLRVKTWADELADQIGEKLEVNLEEKEMNLNLYPKEHPYEGFARDPKRIDCSLSETEQELEIEFDDEKALSAFSLKIGADDQPSDPAKVHQKAIQRIKKYWKDYSNNHTQTGTINGKNLTAVLGANWESGFTNLVTWSDIKQYETQLNQKILNEIRNREIKIKFTVKEAKELLAESEYSTNNFISCKIKSDFLMSTLFPHLELIHGKPQDGPFSEITFIFNNQQVNSEVWNSLVDSEDEEFELSFNLSKIYFFINHIFNDPNQDKPKVSMFAESRRLEVFFKHSNAFNVITIQKTGESPNDETPKLNDLTNLLDTAFLPDSSDQDKIAALKKAGELEGFISSENLTKITQINQQLANKPVQLRQALSEKIENQLTANNLTIDDLPTESKTLYQQFKNSSLPIHQVQTAEASLTTIIGIRGAKKTLDNLETQIRKILSSSDQEEKLRLQKLLRKFIKSKNTFYQNEKTRAQQLNKELKESIQNNESNQNSETPWEKIILFSCIGIGLTLIILLVTNLSKNSRRR